MRKEFWLVTLDCTGSVSELVGGPYVSTDGVEKEAAIIERMGLLGDRALYAAEINITDLTGKHSPVNEEAIGTLVSAQTAIGKTREGGRDG